MAVHSTAVETYWETEVKAKYLVSDTVLFLELDQRAAIAMYLDQYLC